MHRQRPYHHQDGSALAATEAPLGRPTAITANTLPGHAARRSEPEVPDYLQRHYWWAYLWPPAVWFFDHQPIINMIVFGQYRKLVDGTLSMLTPEGDGSNLMIASAYGCVVPRLAECLDDQPLTLIDVAPVQLERAEIKLRTAGCTRGVQLARMNAERLTYRDDSYTRSLIFLLLHELPLDARRRALAEAVRVTRSGGELVMAEYGEITPRHPFHRFGLFRWIFGTAEPFLPSLQRQDLDELVDECAQASGKRAVRESRQLFFGGFYRVVRYRIERNREGAR